MNLNYLANDSHKQEKQHAVSFCFWSLFKIAVWASLL